MIDEDIRIEIPSHSIGEETYAIDGKMDLTDDLTWIVDPIDGEGDGLYLIGIRWPR
jgi:fructose-1,6-bisphosphatase/inositol monophosphatase family enzyme